MLNYLTIMAAEECVQTALFGCYSGGIWGILGIAVDVLTIAIGAAAVIGIIISGIQYATASGDPAMVTKAKNRMLQIVLGIVVYGIFYAFLRWLLPGWN